jgi:hypothetical protein
MLPAYQNGTLNQDLVIKRRVMGNLKRKFSVVQDVKLIQDTGKASELNVAIQNNLVTLNSLLAESLSYFVQGGMPVRGDIFSPTSYYSESYVRPQLSQTMRQILIMSNTLKQNVKSIQPVLNYLSKTDIENLIQLLNELDDRYTEIFLTAGELEGGMDTEDAVNVEQFKAELEKSIPPVHLALRTFIKQYSPAVANIPVREASRNPDGGYSLPKT